MTNLLFLSSSAEARSPTAADIFKNSPNYEADFAGVGPTADISVTQEMVDWADKIIVMESWQKDELFSLFPLSIVKDVEILDVEEKDYSFGDFELVEILKRRLSALGIGK